MPHSHDADPTAVTLWADQPQGTRRSPLPAILRLAGTRPIEFRAEADGSVWCSMSGRHWWHLSIAGDWRYWPAVACEWSAMLRVPARAVVNLINAY